MRLQQTIPLAARLGLAFLILLDIERLVPFRTLTNAVEIVFQTRTIPSSEDTPTFWCISTCLGGPETRD